jgi:hypothetical protein
MHATKREKRKTKGKGREAATIAVTDKRGMGDVNEMCTVTHMYDFINGHKYDKFKTKLKKSYMLGGSNC